MQHRGSIAAGIPTTKGRSVSETCGKIAFVWGTTPPAWTVAYEEPLDEWDSGFSVLLDDAPTSEELEGLPDGEKHPLMNVWCLHCLLDEHPEIGRGMDIARRAFPGGEEAGVAELGEDGRWLVGQAGN